MDIKVGMDVNTPYGIGKVVFISPSGSYLVTFEDHEMPNKANLHDGNNYRLGYGYTHPTETCWYFASCSLKVINHQFEFEF